MNGSGSRLLRTGRVGAGLSMLTLLFGCTDGGAEQSTPEALGAVRQEIKTVIPSEITETAPAAAYFWRTRERYLFWTGTDGNTRLNVLRSTQEGAWTDKITLPFSVSNAAGISVQEFDGNLWIAYTTPGEDVRLIRTSDGRNFVGEFAVPVARSEVAPALAATCRPGTCGASDSLFLAWTGTDDRLNVTSVSQPALATDAVTAWNAAAATTFSERSPHRPALAFFGSELRLAWTGTDENLNLASLVTGSPSKKIVFSDTSEDGPSLATWFELDDPQELLVPNHTRLWLAWRGAGNESLNWAELDAAELAALEAASGRPAVPGKVIAGERSEETPTLAHLGSNLAVTWRGTDDNTRVNVFEGLAVSTLGACLDGTRRDVDNDRDAIPDCWERAGVDINGDGVVDLNFTGAAIGGVPPIDPTLAASDTVPDIYVEVDWWSCAAGGCPMGVMSNWQPPNAVLAPVIQVFAAHNYNLHIVPSQALPVPVAPTTGGAFVCNNNCLQQSYTTNLGNPGDSAATLGLKRRHFLYNLWADAQASGSSGLSIGIPFMVTQGVPPAGMLNNAQVAFWGGTFMHELGHSLGLGHGGGDGVNWKPNHYSVMNYAYQRVGLDLATTVAVENALNYNEVSHSLDESALNESVPISTTNSFLMTFICPNGVPAPGRADIGVNWDCIGGMPPSGALAGAFDLNNDRRCVTPGATGILLTQTPAGDDVRSDAAATVVAGADGTLETTAAGDDVLAVGLGVMPGPNGNIDSVIAATDQLQGALIWDESYPTPLPASNRVCETAAGSDATGNSDFQGHFDQGYQVGATQPVTLDVINEWAALRLRLPTNGGGALPPPVTEAPARELLRETQRRSISDLVLSASVSLTSTFLDGTVVTLDYQLSNQGPQIAYFPAFNLPLPSGVSLVSCAAPAAGHCVEGAGRVLAGSLSELGPGQSVTFRVRLAVGCDVPVGKELVFDVRAATWSIDEDPSSNRRSSSITVGLRLSDFSLLGAGSLLLEDRVKLWTADGAGRPLAGNSGSILTRIGVEAQTGSVLSLSGIDVRDRAKVFGDLVSFGTITRGNEVAITGAFRERTSLNPFPSLASGITITTLGPSHHLEPDQVLALAPGAYGTVHIKSRSRLRMSAGRYTFGSFFVEPQAVIELDQANGPVSIVVRDQTFQRGTYLATAGAGKNLVFVYLGTQAVVIESPFTGTLLAEQARLELATKGPYRGAFFARELQVRPDADVYHVPYCVTSKP